jgi:hypothetical protein
MSIAEMVRNQSPFDVLPTWRKVAIVCCIGLAILTGVMSFNGEINSYGSAPSHPVVTTGQTFLVFVNHGSARYVTQREKDDLEFWRSNGGLLVGVPMLLAFFVWITYRTPGPR